MPKNQIPPKEVVKVAFILEPYQNLLPPIATDGSVVLYVGIVHGADSSK